MEQHVKIKVPNESTSNKLGAFEGGDHLTGMDTKGQACARCTQPMLPIEDDRIKIGRYTYCAGCAEKVKKAQA